MSKVILIFINILGFLLLTTLNINNENIIHTTPKEIPVGKEIEVNLIINKDNFSGPGRLKLDLSQASGILVKENINDEFSFHLKIMKHFLFGMTYQMKKMCYPIRL